MANKQLSSALLFLAGGLLAAGITGDVARGENIDPDNNDSQVAWGENVGWQNAELDWNGDGTIDGGVHVYDHELTGWIWGENVGWVSLSCDNTASCGTTEYRVHHDGCGNLRGYGWGENVGWVNFSCDTNGYCATSDYGVKIYPTTGEFSGQAWAENLGWINFDWGFAPPNNMKTSWTALVPSGSPALTLVHIDPVTTLDWTPLATASGYDVVEGDLITLHLGGDLTAATTDCLANDYAGTSVNHGTSPPAGDGFWFLVRGLNCVGNGTYDSGGAGQVAPRDAAIDLSPLACP
jgi:hypothetical protein